MATEVTSRGDRSGHGPAAGQQRRRTGGGERGVMVSFQARGRWAALLLAGLTPVLAELSLGNPPLRQAWLLLLWTPIYGAGTVLIRDLVRRAGRGWGSVLLLGLAYGIVEEGLALQALTSPAMYGAAGWAPRVLGLNSAYTELNLPYHAVFSVALPILLADLIVPSLRHRPYLGRAGLVTAGAVFVLGALLLRWTASFVDPGYVLPAAAAAVFVVLVAGLAVLALRVVPRPAVAAGGPAGGAARVPAPPVVAVAALVAAFGYLALLFPFGGADHPAFTRGGWVAAPMAGAVLLAVAAGTLLRRWTAHGGWRDRHSLALAGGALVGHTAFGVAANGDTAADRLSLAGLGLVMIVALALLARRTR
ncbi:hypothetical protein [Nonomuraea sp. WAC 01424]|uniref:hypothetical protein n=1 Tax=Nonomuraea sp. WAC 01424 TaxID=2203200 RepID=UPI001C8BA518|nr:hypothetical protein [Nonomuraea sp. WAC 01424]